MKTVRLVPRKILSPHVRCAQEAFRTLKEEHGLRVRTLGTIINRDYLELPRLEGKNALLSEERLEFLCNYAAENAVKAFGKERGARGKRRVRFTVMKTGHTGRLTAWKSNPPYFQIKFYLEKE
jgi:hypothetical protein